LSTSSEAFFVRCDETTMTASDFDHGRAVCEIGFALADPPTSVRLTLALGEFGADAAVRIS
jgi:phage tail sheath protein FI